MKSKAEYVWFPHMFKSIEATANNCLTCRQTGKNLACIPNVTKPAPRPPGVQSLDELEVDFLGPLFQNPTTQHYILIAVDRYSRYPFAMCCAAPTADNVVKFLSDHKFSPIPNPCAQIKAPRSLHIQLNFGVHRIANSVMIPR